MPKATLAAAAPPGDRPEHWRVDAGSDDVATLHIPPSAQRERVFELDLRFIVRAPSDIKGAWHEMNVDLNGAREWSRRIAAHSPGQPDSLDYHCRCIVPVGQALRVRAVTKVRGSIRTRLLIEAEEAER